MFERRTTGLNAVLVALVLGYVEIKARRTMDALLTAISGGQLPTCPVMAEIVYEQLTGAQVLSMLRITCRVFTRRGYS